MSSTPQLEDGFLRIANELIEVILGFGFSHREQSVLFTIIRKTYGFGKKEDDISASQIGAMCKIARQHVTSTLNLLALRNVITKRAGRFGSVRRPILSDLRDSGEIEQDADVVMFVHRPEMHSPENTQLKGYAEVMIRKQRSGALGDIPMLFDGPTCRFSEWMGAIPSQHVPKSRGKSKFDE